MGYYTEPVRDNGQLVKVGPNTKGTGRQGVPVAIAEMGRDKLVPAVENTDGKKGGPGASGTDNLRDLGHRKTIAADPASRTGNVVAKKS